MPNGSPRGETFLDDTKSSSEGDTERQMSHSEKDTRSNASEDLKLDATGLPLVPQPSRFKDDPLVSSTFPRVNTCAPCCKDISESQIPICQKDRQAPAQERGVTMQ